MFGLGDAEMVVVDALNAEHVGEISTGWGKTTARFYRSQKLQIVGLPHLSRYQILGRVGAEELEVRLKSLFVG